MDHQDLYQNLIQAFFAALNERDFDRCEQVLTQIQVQAETDPGVAPWGDYFAGVLANERDHDYAEAERIFNRLLQHDFDPALRGRVLLALGLAYDYQGRWQEAIQSYEQSLPIFDQLNQPLDQARAWKNIAMTYRKGFTQGDFGREALAQAEAYGRRALDLLQAMPDRTTAIRRQESILWNALGTIYRLAGRWAEAIRCYQCRLDESLALDDRFGAGHAYGNLGEIYQLQGVDHWPAALHAYQQALAIFREFDDAYELVEVLANLASLYHENGKFDLALDCYKEAIEFIEQLRAGVTSETARLGFFTTTTNIYAHAILLCQAMGRPADALHYVERARTRAFLDVLASGTADLPRQIDLLPLTLAEIQHRLPPDALLLEYFTVGLEAARLGPKAARQGIERHRFPPAKTLLFAVTRTTIDLYDTGLSPNHLQPSQLDSTSQRHFLDRTLRQRLYRQLVGPVEAMLPGVTRLYLVPHGPLHYLPFQALLDDQDKPLLCQTGPEIIFGPSATLLFHPQLRKRPTAAAFDACLALGYNGTGADQLHFAEMEASRVAELTSGSALVGVGPKRTLLYQLADQYRFLHFACHGSFNPESPLSSKLQIAPDEALTASDVLTNLKLRCELVTLSACESGLTNVRRGDELIGLIRAFIYAGTSGLIATLWRVDDRSTRILMEKFYQELQNGINFSQALKRAQLYLRRLTRKEAQMILKTPTSPLTELPSSELPLDDSDRQMSLATLAYDQPPDQQTLSQSAKDSLDKLLSMGADDTLIFADPLYWAPFIFIGHPESAILKPDQPHQYQA